MELNLKKPLVFFDLETTGLNITSDKIVEISYIKVFPNGTEESKTLRVNPGMHIPEQATPHHRRRCEGLPHIQAGGTLIGIGV